MKEEDLALFIKLFSGRKGVLKVRSSKTNVFENLTQQHLIRQLKLQESYGIYLRSENDTVKFAMFDLDVKNSKLPSRQLLSEIKQIRPIVESIINAADKLGLARNNYLIEFPGVGYHIWFFFEDDLPAGAAAAFLDKIKNAAEIGPVIFKPRPIQANKESFGEAVWLPLRFNDNSNLHSVFITDWDNFDPADYDPAPSFEPLHDIKPIPTALVTKICSMDQ